MWYVITKLVANCKDDVQLIKIVNLKAVILFIRILKCLVWNKYPKTYQNVKIHAKQKQFKYGTKLVWVIWALTL